MESAAGAEQTNERKTRDGRDVVAKEVQKSTRHEQVGAPVQGCNASSRPTVAPARSAAVINTRKADEPKTTKNAAAVRHLGFGMHNTRQRVPCMLSAACHAVISFLARFWECSLCGGVRFVKTPREGEW